MEPGLKIKTEEFESILEELNKKTKDVEEQLSNIDRFMSEIKTDDENWKGKTAAKIKTVYSAFNKNFPNITTQLNTNNKFLRTTVEDYKQAEKQIKMDIDKNNSNLSIE